MESTLAWLGASAFFLVISSSLYELVSGRAPRFGSTWRSRRASWSQRQVRFAAIGTLLMGVGGPVQVWVCCGADAHGRLRSHFMAQPLHSRLSRSYSLTWPFVAGRTRRDPTDEALGATGRQSSRKHDLRPSVPTASVEQTANGDFLTDQRASSFSDLRRIVDGRCLKEIWAVAVVTIIGAWAGGGLNLVARRRREIDSTGECTPSYAPS